MKLLKESIHKRLLEKKKRLDSLRPLPPVVVKKLHEQMQLEFTYNSNAIEGNTLSLRETQLVIEEGITIRGKSLREHLEARNHPEGIAYIESLVGKERAMREEDVLKVHRLLMNGIDEVSGGRYRTTLVRITGASFMPPPPDEIGRLMGVLLEWLRENPDELRAIELAAVFHHRFVCIHPFVDGNGRVGRLLMNAILLRTGYPFVIILKVDRQRYLGTLSLADSGTLLSFVNFVARCVERSLDVYLSSVEEDAEVLTLSEASRLTPYSQEYLSLLARRGRLGAFKQGRIWMIRKKALEEYLKSHSRKAHK